MCAVELLQSVPNISLCACNKYVYVCKQRPGTRLAGKLIGLGYISTSATLAVKHSGCFPPSKNKLIKRSIFCLLLNLWAVLLPVAKLLAFCGFFHFFLVACYINICSAFSLVFGGFRLKVQTMRKSFNTAKYQDGGELNMEKRCLWGRWPLELLVVTFLL